MFGTKIKIDSDEIIDYKKFSKNISDEEVVVEDHRVMCSATKICKNLVASLKYVLLELIPTKKFTLEESDIETNEAKIITSKVVKQLQMVRISRECPFDSFKLVYKYSDKLVPNPETGKTYKNVNTREIVLFNSDGSNGKAGKYFNAMDFCSLEFGKYIKINGRIESHTSYSANSIHKFITTAFRQKFTEESNDVIEYYNGTFEFHYIDNCDATEVLIEALKVIVGIIDEIMAKEDKFELSLGCYSVIVPLDRSGVIAYLIDAYILMQTKNMVIKADKNSINGVTKMSFEGIESDELSVILDKALKALKQELAAIIASLK